MDSWFNRRADNEARTTRNARPVISELRNDLLIGEYPRECDIPWLKEQYRVSGVHSLQDDDDLRINGLDFGALDEVCQRHGIRLVRTPIQDGSSDDMAARLGAALEALRQLVRENRRVYLHCNAGMNRAPTLAIAYLRTDCGMSLNEALAHVKARRACGPFMTILEAHFGARDYKPGI